MNKHGVGEGACYICHGDAHVIALPCPRGGTCHNVLCAECVVDWAWTGYRCMICRQSLSGVRVVQMEFGHSVPRSASDAEDIACLLCLILFGIGVALSIIVMVIISPHTGFLATPTRRS